MHPAVVIALKDLRQRLRDRSALVLGFVAPLAVAWLVSAAFGSVSSFHMDVAVVDRDRGEVAAAFQTFLRSPELSELLTVTVVATEAEARAQVEDGTLSAAYVVPEGLTAAVTSGGGLPVTVLGSVDASVAARVARSLASSFTAQIEAVRLSVATAVDAGAPHAQAAELAAAAAVLQPPETLMPQSSSLRPARHDQLLRAGHGHLLHALRDRLRLPWLLPREVRRHDGAARGRTHQARFRGAGQVPGDLRLRRHQPGHRRSGDHASSSTPTGALPSPSWP